MISSLLQQRTGRSRLSVSTIVLFLCLLVAIMSTKASTNEATTVTVALCLMAFTSGSPNVVELQKDIFLPTSVVERAKKETHYDGCTTSAFARSLLDANIPELLSLRTSWCCVNCKGTFARFQALPNGFRSTKDEHGNDNFGISILPVCTKEACKVRSMRMYTEYLVLCDRELRKREANPKRTLQVSVFVATSQRRRTKHSSTVVVAKPNSTALVNIRLLTGPFTRKRAVRLLTRKPIEQNISRVPTSQHVSSYYHSISTVESRR